MYLIIGIITIAMVYSKETISDKIWLNHIDDYDLNKKATKSHILNEGFLLLSNNRKKSSVVTRKTITGIDTKNQTSTSIDNGDEIDTFLKVNDEQLINIEAAIDGSGDSKFTMPIHYLINYFFFFY